MADIHVLERLVRLCDELATTAERDDNDRLVEHYRLRQAHYAQALRERRTQMTDPQWTPGRWQAGDNDGESIVIFAYADPDDSEGVHVATVEWPHEDAYDYESTGSGLDEAIRHRAQAWPNAMLIQTAPELYEALLALVKAIDGLPARHPTAPISLAINQALQALVKATGINE